MYPGTHISFILLCSAIFTRGLGSCFTVNSFVSCVVVASKGFIYSRRTACSDGKTDWNLLQFLLEHLWEHWIMGILIFCPLPSTNVFPLCHLNTFSEYNLYNIVCIIVFLRFSQCIVSVTRNITLITWAITSFRSLSTLSTALHTWSAVTVH